VADISRMKNWALTKRVEALERAVEGLFDLRAAITNFAHANGMRVEACELRSRFALALAENSPDVQEHRRRWEEFKQRAIAQYPELEP